MKPLQPNESGSHVQEIQSWLIKAGERIALSGRNDLHTQSALKRFTQKCGKPVSNVISGEILELLKKRATMVPEKRIAEPSRKRIEFLTAIQRVNVAPKECPDEVAIIVLGRFGDIYNALPIAYYVHGVLARRPHFVVSKQFADALSGVSYVVPVVVDRVYDDKSVIEMIKAKYGHVIVPQTWWGDKRPVEKLTQSWNTEAYRLAGFPDQFDAWPLVIDRRDREREEKFLDTWRDVSKPLVLLSLQGGISSPYPPHLYQELVPALKEQIQRFAHPVDLDGVRAEQPHDLLALFERAKCLITTDTMSMHLACASSIPMVALVNTRPWFGSAARRAGVLRMTYNEAPFRIDDIVSFARSHAVDKKRIEVSPPSFSSRVGKIIHAVELHANTPDEVNRKLRAQETWKKLGWTAAYYCDYVRDASKELGDQRVLPYLKDVLANALRGASDDDIVVLTNDDVALSPALTPLIRDRVRLYGACCSSRVDVDQLPPMEMKPAELATFGTPHMGRDLFAFKVSVLRSWFDEIPDYVLGAAEWDIGLTAFIRWKRGTRTTLENMSEQTFMELDPGAVLHERHKAYWTKPEVFARSPSQMHNRQLLKDWCDAEMPSLRLSTFDVLKTTNPELHIFTIVLNGEPFIRYHIHELNKLRGINWTWHIIEGCANLYHDTAWSLRTGGRLEPWWHRDGLSVDGTTEFLDQLRADYPNRVRIHRTKGLWDGKIEMVRAFMDELPGYCILLQVDVDELWSCESIQKLYESFVEFPAKTAAYLKCRYFLLPDAYVGENGTEYAQRERDWLRAWRYYKGMQWQSHEPPILLDWEGRDTATVEPFMPKELPVSFEHFAYVLPSQVLFKESYYGYGGLYKAWLRLKAEARQNLVLKGIWPRIEDDAKLQLQPVNRYTGMPESANPMGVHRWHQMEVELRRLIFKDTSITQVVETGTYDGHGTTSILHQALSDAKRGGHIYTVECNPNYFLLAQKLFKGKSGITFLQGLSIPRRLLPTLETIQRDFVDNVVDGIYYDHEPKDRARLYFEESRAKGPDNMLFRAYQRAGMKPDLVLLDSGGHIGWQEFELFLSFTRHPCYLVLDDTMHCKHHCSLLAIRRNTKFEILVESTERFGFVIARYTP